MLRKLLNSLVVRRSGDLMLSPITLMAAIWYKYVRSGKMTSMPLTKKIFMKVGVLPVNDHYYQPMINPGKYLHKPLNQDRDLPSVDFNVNEQLQLLSDFNYAAELRHVPINKPKNTTPAFYFNNPSFCPGDASFYYNLLRHFKPNRIIEIGCGYSTLLAQEAANANKKENPAYDCKHICVEPYEMPWLEQLQVEVRRNKVEELELSFFSQLRQDDILFIDSSHMIRPQGDVLYEFLVILPTLNPGVIIHVHDVFSPKDYPKEWIMDEHSFWNEQYLLEAFLSFNKEFRVIGSLNYLKHHHRAVFDEKCPASASIPDDEPGSFWMMRN